MRRDRQSRDVDLHVLSLVENDDFCSDPVVNLGGDSKLDRRNGDVAGAVSFVGLCVGAFDFDNATDLQTVEPSVLLSLEPGDHPLLLDDHLVLVGDALFQVLHAPLPCLRDAPRLTSVPARAR